MKVERYLSADEKNQKCKSTKDRQLNSNKFTLLELKIVTKSLEPRKKQPQIKSLSQ